VENKYLKVSVRLAKKINISCASLLLAASAVTGMGQVHAAENISWGGSNPGGVMYYMVGTAGTIISEKLPQYNVTQVTTGGSTENAKRLIKGHLKMAPKVPCCGAWQKPILVPLILLHYQAQV
jgi:hypothetical protein